MAVSATDPEDTVDLRETIPTQTRATIEENMWEKIYEKVRDFVKDHPTYAIIAAAVLLVIIIIIIIICCCCCCRRRNNDEKDYQDLPEKSASASADAQSKEEGAASKDAEPSVEMQDMSPPKKKNLKHSSSTVPLLATVAQPPPTAHSNLGRLDEEVEAMCVAPPYYRFDLPPRRSIFSIVHAASARERLTGEAFAARVGYEVGGALQHILAVLSGEADAQGGSAGRQCTSASMQEMIECFSPHSILVTGDDQLELAVLPSSLYVDLYNANGRTYDTQLAAEEALRYKSPEAVLNPDSQDPQTLQRSLVYTLALITYEVASGVMPYRGMSGTEAGEMLMSCTIPTLTAASSLSPAFAALIRSAVISIASERPSIQEFLNKLTSFLPSSLVRPAVEGTDGSE